MIKITKSNIDEMVADLNRKILFLRLVNSGQSNVSDQQDALVKDVFVLGYAIQMYAFNKRNLGLFNRIYERMRELVPSDNIKSVMKHPEMYESMVKTKKKFFERVDPLHDVLVQYAIDTGRIKR